MSSAESSIGVIGGGYVGLVSGACFAALGFDVTIVEADATKLQALRANRVPIYEPGLTELVEEGVEAGRLHFVSSVKEMFSASQVDVVFIAVGTPQRPDGSCNLDYVRTAALDVARGATREVVLVLKSTVPAGTARALLTTIRAELPNKKIAVVNNPEFLTEGNAVADFMRPARVVIGASESWAGEKVKALYESLLNNGHPLFVTDHETAELSKLASNLMLASRISLINQVSRLSDALGADIRQIESIMRSDPRIGPKYLYAGIGYGGSCFPKDVKSFVNQCEVAGVDASMAKSVDQFNDSQKAFFVPHIQKRFPKAAGTKVALLGVAFKPNTDDIRESPALMLTEKLTGLGYSVQVYDPKGLPNFEAWAKGKELKNISFHRTAAEALKGADALVVATEWQEFQRLSPENLKSEFSGKVIYDGKNIFKPAAFKAAGFEYLGVGRR